MSLLVFSVVITAALLHAIWNGLVKSQDNKLLTMTAVVIGAGFVGLVTLPFTGLPHGDSYGYLAIAIIIHIGYQMFLALAYTHGDLSLVYPISRGTAPLLVTIFSILVLGIEFSTLSMLGLGSIIFAVFCMVFSNSSDFNGNGKAIILALITACFIASYSLIDGFGARLAGNAVSFYASLAIINGFGFIAFMAVRKPQNIKLIFISKKMVMLIGGGASFLGFALILWAFTQTSIATVSTLREVSIIFVMLIGVFLFKEKFGIMKMIALAFCLLGLVLLRLN
ncbi:MAG: EamA family transporter [Rhizobiales bacterium]|nr:EamA family transporter [Hyphomicrobiales bacterium]